MNKKAQTNPKGSALIQLFVFVFVIFFAVLFIGISMIFFNQVTTALDRDIDLGQVNLQDVNAATFGQINLAMINHADKLGIALILGSFVGMMGTAFFFGRSNFRLMIIAEIFILIAIFIVSVYLSNAYSIIINSTPYLSVFENDLTQTSTLLLNLPVLVSIMGVILIVVFYLGFKENEPQFQVLQEQ